jgi:hypothetical protein
MQRAEPGRAAPVLAELAEGLGSGWGTDGRDLGGRDEPSPAGRTATPDRPAADINRLGEPLPCQHFLVIGRTGHAREPKRATRSSARHRRPVLAAETLRLSASALEPAHAPKGEARVLILRRAFGATVRFGPPGAATRFEVYEALFGERSGP